VHSLQGNHQGALEAYALALQIKPDDVETLVNKGSTCNDVKNYALALEVLEKAIGIRPDLPEAWSNKGIALNNLNFHHESVIAFDEAIKLNPSYFEAWSNKSVPLNKLKRYAEASEACDEALSLNPDYAEAWSNKGAALNQLKRYEEAIAHYDKALSLKPGYAEAWSNKGNSLHELKRHEEAIAHHDKALSLKPDYAEGWSNKGVSLNELKRYEEAIAHHDKALSLKPDYAEAWSNKGVVLNELKRYEAAVASYDRALGLKPDIDWACGDFLHIKMKICSWENFQEEVKNLAQKVLSQQKTSPPFQLLSLTDDAFLHKQCAEIYAHDKYPINSALGSIPKSVKKEKIRIGYFSPDFGNHAVSFLTAELFELQDRNRFEIIAFSFGVEDKSPMRLRLMQAFDRFIVVSSMSDIEVAKLARELHIDIAVDLAGYTKDGRTGIFAYRAAPLQVSYIGYLGTMGVKYMDYLIADKTIVPEHLQKFYSEKIAYLPSYQVNDRKRIIANKQFTRQELGLPENAFVFCCFNNGYKILPSTFDGWMRILKAVKESVLFLYAENQWAEENLIKEAEARGIASQRLVFGKLLPPDEYLARYRICDLFLDTAPYNAGSDALRAGLPLLTLMGQSFSGRVAASLLTAIDLPELITTTQAAYEARAIEFANNPQKLLAIRRKLADNFSSTPLFDTPLFTRNLESAYAMMYERYQADLEPDHIFINQAAVQVSQESLTAVAAARL
jgi:predicted O-linked N-acetylglucosamine transferase (SPINDLY family)